VTIIQQSALQKFDTMITWHHCFLLGFFINCVLAAWGWKDLSKIQNDQYRLYT